MERPDSLLSIVTGWIAAGALGAKILFDLLTTRSAKRKGEAEIAKLSREGAAEQIKAETEKEQNLFDRAYRQLDAQDKRIAELETEVADQRKELRRLNAIEDRAIRDGLAHEREALAWRAREEDLLAQLAAAIQRADRAERPAAGTLP